MKKIFILFLIIYPIHIFSQEVDIVTPQQNVFNSGQNIGGFVQGSVNEPTGKVNFSIPISQLSARDVSYPLVLGYNGDLAFEAGSKTNRYVPTSVAGVGFGLFIPKIVVDNKSTATLEDDTFFLQDGATNTELIFSERIEAGFLGTNKIIFTAKDYVPWKIEYFESELNIITGSIQERPLNYWKVTNEQGVEYFYGQTQNSRESVVAWGNWMGSSSLSSGGNSNTIVWNLSTIRDQWFNSIRFEYDHQQVIMGGAIQTEATYLSKIISSTGESIKLFYADKNSNEIYEPNREYPEPDAYQERYEKRYLDYITTHNSDNELVYSYDLTYILVNNSSSTDKKRYLSNITQENALGEIKPAQQFEYHTTGAFKGGIKKIIYPTGSSVTYSYERKFLFRNSTNKYVDTAPNTSGYEFYASVSKDNYSLMLLKSQSPYSGSLHDFMVVRNWWNGNGWERSSFNFPYRINDDGNRVRLENFQTIFGNDFYGFLHQEGSVGRLDLFHLKDDGHTWSHRVIRNIDVGDGKARLLSGTNFVAVGSHRNGKLYTYRWHDSTWHIRTINQGGGQYYYGANNNFILSLDEDGGSDMVTGVNHEDNYYFHYLGIENDWKTKSWSQAVDPFLAGIEKPSSFYPENAMAGFVADDNPEVFLRWDSNYDLITVDTDVFGSSDDRNPMISTYAGMFTLQNFFFQYPIRSARFNGQSWITDRMPSFGSNYAKPAYGEDVMLFQNFQRSASVGYLLYEPNGEAWNYSSYLNPYSSTQNSTQKLTGVTRDFVVGGNKIYMRSNTSRFSQSYDITGADNVFTHTDGLDHAFVETRSTANQARSGRFYGVDKATNQINYTNLGNVFNLSGYTSFGGRTPFISPKTVWLRGETGTNATFNTFLYRVIDDKVNNTIYDEVVSKIKVDNGEGELRETVYSYNNPNMVSTSESIFYSNVIIENKGYGNASIGTVEKIYNNGREDARMIGLPLEEFTKSSTGDVVEHTKYGWEVLDFLSNIDGYTIKQTSQENVEYRNGKPLKVVTNTRYSSYYLPDLVTTTNSKGQTETLRTIYAFSEMPELESKNFLSLPYQVTKRVDNRIVSISETKWVIDDNRKVYASENWSGNSANTMRLTNQVTKISRYGQVLEFNNGKGQYTSTLYGYNDRYMIGSFSNTRYDNVLNNLNVNYRTLQNLDNSNLKTELSKLYTRLPEAMIHLNFYDNNGNRVLEMDEREYEINFGYDGFHRLDYISNHNNKVLRKNIYNSK